MPLLNSTCLQAAVIQAISLTRRVSQSPLTSSFLQLTTRTSPGTSSPSMCSRSLGSRFHPNSTTVLLLIISNSCRLRLKEPRAPTAQVTATEAGMGKKRTTQRRKWWWTCATTWLWVATRSSPRSSGATRTLSTVTNRSTNSSRSSSRNCQGAKWSRSRSREARIDPQNTWRSQPNRPSSPAYRIIIIRAARSSIRPSSQCDIFK